MNCIMYVSICTYGIDPWSVWAYNILATISSTWRGGQRDSSSKFSRPYVGADDRRRRRSSASINLQVSGLRWARWAPSRTVRTPGLGLTTLVEWIGPCRKQDGRSFKSFQFCISVLKSEQARTQLLLQFQFWTDATYGLKSNPFIAAKKYD
jgi:hypothetical protein